MIVDRTLLSYPSVKSKVTLGDCAFIFAAPTLWNNILYLEILENLTQLTVLIGKLRLGCLKELLI